MNAIETMIKEHDNIRRMLKIIRKYCYEILKDEYVDYKDFYKIIDFVRFYADRHHHSKEENILFTIMDEQYNMLKNGPLTGMLIEHDMGRMYIHNLEEALKELEKGNQEAKLDIIANSISYTNLLNRHIYKENNTIYKFSEASLSAENKKRLNFECCKIESMASKNELQRKYVSLIKYLEDKINNYNL
ncbi:hemerythrin domain-containing protein [Clostridium rectalis]|uniref:hemerythrin domain-containing protein n=1 Tax=Clostridium rectalis TaxID=2040295 RepID=UPI000F62F03F|nr:hemerythrin domain-containing protein [Clostridium rectalis]